MKLSLKLPSLTTVVGAAALLGGATCWAAAPSLPLPSRISLDAIPVCYDFGCKRQSTITLPPHEWASVANWFAPPAPTPAAEREQIKQAVGWMETVVGRHTPTHKDLAFDLPPNADDIRDSLFPGQLDCIDEAVNTITYLKLFEMNGLLKHHVVIQAAYRRALFDQHWAGQIQEKRSDTRFVVDSWFQPNGFLPVMQNSKQWEDISPLTAVVDNSADTARRNTTGAGTADAAVTTVANASATRSRRSFWRWWRRQ